MSKREYTHVRLLYPEIKAMIEAGKTQREIAEYYGFKDKYVVKGLLKKSVGEMQKMFLSSEAVSLQKH